MAGISPIDIYRNRKGEAEPYIHLHQESFINALKPTITEREISSEYLRQARKLENQSMKFFEGLVSKQDFDDIIQLQKNAYKENYKDEVLMVIFKELETGFGTNIGSRNQIGGAKEQANVEYIYQALTDAIDTISEIDSVIFDYLGSPGNFPSKEGSLISLSQTESNRAKAQFNNLIKIRQDLRTAGTSLDIEKIVKSVKYGVSIIKGEMMEVVNACAKQQALNALEGIFTQAKITGDIKVDITENKKVLETLSTQTKKVGSITSKPDSVQFFTSFDSTTGEIKSMGAIGESTKSYKIGTSAKIHAVGATPWANIFTMSDLINTQFEYLYANSYYHNQADFKDGNNIMNRYLGARTISYAYAGQMLSSNNPPALFLAGTDRAIYLPDLFRDMAQKKVAPFSLSVSGASDNNELYQGDGTPEEQGYIRSKKILQSLRNKIKFEG